MFLTSKLLTALSPLRRDLFWTAIAKGADQDVGKSGAAKTRYENGGFICNVGERSVGQLASPLQLASATW